MRPSKTISTKNLASRLGYCLRHTQNLCRTGRIPLPYEATRAHPKANWRIIVHEGSYSMEHGWTASPPLPITTPPTP